MRPGRRLLLVGAIYVASLTVATGYRVAPEVLRAALGIPMVLLLPGFAVVCALFPKRQLSRGEILLASVGMSLGVTICGGVLLGATPIGLSRTSLSVLLGGLTIALSIYAAIRGWDMELMTEPRARVGVEVLYPSGQ